MRKKSSIRLNKPATLKGMGFKIPPGHFTKSNKYGNRMTDCRAGHHHRSKLEASVCSILQLRIRTGELKEVKVEDRLYLTDAKIAYVADFRCVRADGEIFWVEAKGHPTDAWTLKKKLWTIYGPGTLEVWKGTYLNPLLIEVVEPQHAVPKEFVILK